MARFLFLLVCIVCGCKSTTPPKRNVEISVDAPVGSPEKTRVTATITASF